MLATLGEREGGTARLEQAVAAEQSALKILTRDQEPPRWAKAESNLGNAHEKLRDRRGDTALLQQAVAACRAALQERTRERVPFDWASSQQALANALAVLAKRQQNVVHVEEALTRMLGAVEVYQQSKDGYWLPIAQRRAAEIEAELIELKR